MRRKVGWIKRPPWNQDPFLATTLLIDCTHLGWNRLFTTVTGKAFEGRQRLQLWIRGVSKRGDDMETTAVYNLQLQLVDGSAQPSVVTSAEGHSWHPGTGVASPPLEHPSGEPNQRELC